LNAIDLSIVVAIRNQLAHNQLFFEQVQKATSGRFELIVVDNGSTDGSAEFFHRVGAHVISTGGNLCYPESMNLGLARATGEYVGFLNNDIVVSPEWDTGLIAALNRHSLPVVSPVGVELMPTPILSRVIQERWRVVKRRTGSISTADELRVAIQMMYGDWETFCRRMQTSFPDRLMPGIVGSCVITRRSFMQSIGGWDEQVQAADWDLYLRLSERVDTVGDIHLPMVAGWVYVHHYVQATRRGERAPFTCTHPKLTVQEKWEETALRRLFFDPPLLLAPPKLHQTPVTYLRTRARRAVKDSFRALSLMHMRLFGFPGAETLLNQVDKEALRTEVVR